MIHVFNTTRLDKQYTDADYKGLVPIERFGLDSDFYGGRVKYLGIVPNSDVLLCLEYKDNTYNVIDTAAEKLDNIGIKFIKELCNKRKIKFDHIVKKEELISKLEGR